MSEWAATEDQSVKVRVTVDGFGEGFWVTRTGSNVGVVDNALLNGAISYGDVVEWNDDGEVIAVRSRSDRATMVCWVDLDEDDLPTRAKWAQASEDAVRAWIDRGVVVESGYGSMLMAAFVVREGMSLQMQCLRLLEVLADEDWTLQWEVSPHPGTPTNASALGLTVPPPFDDEEEDVFDASDLPDISPTLVSDNAQRNLIPRLKELGHIHAALDDDELLSVAGHLVSRDLNFYRRCQAGQNDRVLVGAALVLSWDKGLMTPKYEKDVLDMDFLVN